MFDAVSTLPSKVPYRPHLSYNMCDICLDYLSNIIFSENCILRSFSLRVYFQCSDASFLSQVYISSLEGGKKVLITYEPVWGCDHDVGFVVSKMLTVIVSCVNCYIVDQLLTCFCRCVLLNCYFKSF